MSRVVVKCFTQNFASDKAGWTSRSAILSNHIHALDPDVIFCAELYAAQRDRMTSLLADEYTLGSAYYGRVVYFRTTVFGKVAGSDKHFSLPNNKAATGVKVAHRATGKRLNIVAAHLTWQHDRETYRAKETEALVTKVKAAYPDNRTLYGGDWNDSLKFGPRTGDAVGKTFAAHGYRDLFNDVPLEDRKYYAFNSANQYEIPAPKAGIHLDRIFGGNVTGTFWRLDHYAPATVAGYGSDHYGVGVGVWVSL